MTRIGNQVVNSATRSTRPRPDSSSIISAPARCTAAVISSAAFCRMVGMKASRPLPRKNGLSSDRWVACSLPCICRIVRPWMGSSCQS